MQIWKNCLFLNVEFFLLFFFLFFFFFFTHLILRVKLELYNDICVKYGGIMDFEQIGYSVKNVEVKGIY